MCNRSICFGLKLFLICMYIQKSCCLIGDLYALGCFYARDECPNKHIQFWLYKNDSTTHAPLLLNPLKLNASAFAPSLPLKVLLHGYHGNSDFSPNLELRPVLLRTQPVHVLSVDYGTLAPQPCYYPWAVQNARIVAKCLAQLIDKLLEAQIYTAQDLHLIGFSLGAQIAGLTANYVHSRLKHITGLDPASPTFQTTNLEDKLDASDAEFVDVIHTDPFFYSSLEPSGHVDFYPNLERIFQPGCNIIEEGPFAGSRNCNHFRAPLYYAESITSARGFWSYQCGTWLQFFLQRCRDFVHVPNTQMGYFVSANATGAYFLQTESRAPYAKGPLIELELSVSEQLGNELNDN